MNLIDGIIINGSEGVGRFGTAIIIVNAGLFILLFSLAYHKKGFE